MKLTSDRPVLLAAGIMIGLAVGMPIGALITPAPASASPITEDDPAWSCVLDGDHVCGPHNEMGAVPGFYVNGVLTSPWPVIKSCQVVDTELYCDEDYVDPAFVRVMGWPVFV